MKTKVVTKYTGQILWENLYNPIGGATGRSFSPKTSGKYAVEITKNSYVV